MHRGLNSSNVDTFDRACPDAPPVAPAVVHDAADPGFPLELLALLNRLSDGGEGEPDTLDHLYAPTLRGGDASHLIHLALVVHWLTGDDQYLAFLEDVLLADLDVVPVALTAQAFRNPDWCNGFYGDHITYGTHWQLITMLPPGPLRDAMVRVMDEEHWQKGLFNHASAKFDVLYAASGDESELSARPEAIATAVCQLQAFGGPPGHIDAPRRTYQLPVEAVLAGMAAESIEARCPTVAERDACGAGVVVLGGPLGAEDITHPCDGRPAECTFEDSETLCAEALSTVGLPPQLRGYADFMWQRSPFELGDSHGAPGLKQSPGRDLSEPYWMARYYGFITEGAGEVLAWRPTDQPCP